jgi:hypothetical protein
VAGSPADDSHGASQHHVVVGSVRPRVPVGRTAIIGTDLRLVEAVSGRLTTLRATLIGAGALILLIGCPGVQMSER